MIFKKLTAALSLLAAEIKESREQRKTELEWFQTHFKLATKTDLEEMEKRLTMKLSEVKAQVAEAAKQNKEAFQELGKKISDMQTQIDTLIQNASDPDVTDEAFLTDLNSLKETAKQLADIVPNTDTPPTPPA